jgi:hypothetical protein
VLSSLKIGSYTGQVQRFDQVAKFLSGCNIRNIKVLDPNITQIKQG